MVFWNDKGHSEFKSDDPAKQSELQSLTTPDSVPYFYKDVREHLWIQQGYGSLNLLASRNYRDPAVFVNTAENILRVLLNDWCSNRFQL